MARLRTRRHQPQHRKGPSVRPRHLARLVPKGEKKPWPARAATLVRFIDHKAQSRAPATVRRYVSSLCALHRAAGWKNPLDHVTVRMALRRMYRHKGRRQAQALGLTWQIREKLIGSPEEPGERLIDIRNRALLAVAYDAMLRRSELVTLRVSDLVFDHNGSATLFLRNAKTDPEGAGHILFLARDTADLVRAWLAAAESPGPPVPVGQEERRSRGRTRSGPGVPDLQGHGSTGGVRRLRRGAVGAQCPGGGGPGT